MKYVELLGMGASGKTTSLKRLGDLPRTGVVSRIHFEKDLSPFFRRMVGEVSLARSFKAAVLDGWAQGALDTFPQLFSQVLSVLCDVEDSGRTRLILLNWWRSRVRLFSRVIRDSDVGLFIVDEGLSQTVLSTLWRQNWHSRGDSQLQARSLCGLVDSLPNQRCVIVIETSVDELMKRRIQPMEKDALVETIAIMNQIAERSAKNGCDVRRVDGHGTPGEVAERVRCALPRIEPPIPLEYGQRSS